MNKPLIFIKLCLFSTLLFGHQISFAQIEITDSHGKYSFKKPPEKVVVLNWALAEQMLELGVTPSGMADIDGFTKHASKPSVPSEVVDVGDRLSPNLAKLKELEPDIIMIGYSQRSLLRPLSNIATVIYFKNFGARYNNFDKSRERFLELAKLFDKTELAKQKLTYLDAQLVDLKTSLLREFAKLKIASPAVQINVPSSNDSKTWLFGKNSMPYYAASALGLDIVSTQETNQYGVSMVDDAELTKILAPYQENSSNQNNTYLCQLRLTSYAQEDFSKAPSNTTSNTNCVADLTYQNAFGGTMSVLYLAESIYKALIENLD